MGLKVLIVGGVAGGATVAARLRRLDESCEIIIFERGEHISYANCGLPYYIGGVISQRESLLVQTPQGMKDRYNIEVRVKNEVIKITPDAKKISIRNQIDNVEYEENYDILVLSPGASSVWPNIPGLDQSKNVFSLRNIADMDAIKQFINENQPKTATVIGGGFSGLEMLENLHGLGLKVRLVEMLDQVLAPFDYEMAAILHNHLREKGVELILKDGVKSFRNEGKEIELTSGKLLASDLTILAIGVRPETKLAVDAGLAIGEKGGIRVNDHLQTSDPSIYALGDVIDVRDFVTGEQTRITLAWPANRQARIVADNIIGKNETYSGSLGTGIVKVFDYVAAVTGVNEKRLQQRGDEYRVLHIHPGAHAGYYPGSTNLDLKLLFAPDGRILGAQALGPKMADKKIDIIATAIKSGLKVQDLPNLELAYAPQFSSAKDAINMLGYLGSDILDGLVIQKQWHEIAGLDREKYLLLDVREQAEVDLGVISGAINIPLHALRQRMGELPREKEIVVYCQVGLRGYIAARMLAQNGYKVSNLDGGYRTYASVFMPELPRIEAADSGVSILATNPILSQTENTMTAAKVIDASGLQCPGPLQKVYEALKQMQEGEVLQAIATDPAFHIDIEKWCERTGNLMLAKTVDNQKYVVTVQKGKGAGQGMKIHHNEEENKLTMIVFDGDLDKAIAAFIIANGAAAFGKKVVLFFTFWGLNVIRKSGPVSVKKTLVERMFGWMMPRGPKKLQLSHMNMAGMGPVMIKTIMKQKNVSSLSELMSQAQAQGVRLVACTMSMDVMGIKKEELIDGVELGGVASYLGEADTARINMFV